jgi:hypothetical protein
VRNVSQFISDDYGNRFLIELIQNAHDGHERDAVEGEIAVVLRPGEGMHGCLYVANKGKGFEATNLNAITNIALSSKSVNAGIGNKGIGFRSVLQICHWPEIFSVDGIGGTGVFDGFCFRFATEEDLRACIPGNSAEIAREMSENLPCWHVPVPIEPSDYVARFAAEGFATVVRLPLKPGALATVCEQMDALLTQDAPLHLFLERISRISIDRGNGTRGTLTRSKVSSATYIQPGFSPIEVETIHLGRTEYVVGHWDMDKETFESALKQSIEKDEVPQTWKDWEGAARISVAMPIGTKIDEGRLYCFLPLGGEGSAPFPGYLNANFYTKMDRRTVDESLGLNWCLLYAGAWLSSQIIAYLVDHDRTDAANVVVSLLCWEERFLDGLKQGMGDQGRGILNRAFLPVRNGAGGIGWASPAETYAWLTSTGACLSPHRLCEIAGAKLLIDTLTPTQRATLNRMYVKLRGHGFEPPPRQIADWSERIAERMKLDGVAPERWALFYDELAIAMANHASLLFGRRILLNTSGDLISSELPSGDGPGRHRKAADVYFSPVLSLDSDVDDVHQAQALPLERLPTNLRQGFALLNRDVPWLKEDGGHRPGRSFLLAGKLAREYDTRDVLRTLARVTREADTEAARRQALEWAFRLWSSGRSLDEKETRAAEFLVPTADGWVSANSAIFGDGWPVANGQSLHALLKLTADQSEDLARSLARLLPAFDVWPIATGTEHDWTRFLWATGVRACLRPICGDSVLPTPEVIPTSMPDAVIALVGECSQALRSHWRRLLSKDCERMHRTVKYRGLVEAWRLPGQWDVENFPPEIRRAFAVQVIHAIPAIDEERWTFRAVRSTVRETHRLPTPLRAFVTAGNWMPVTRAGGTLRFVKPGDAWWLLPDESNAAPRFMDFVAGPIVRATDEATLNWLKKNAAVGVFNDAQHAGRALRALTDAASTPIVEMKDVRVFRERFRYLWALARASDELSPGTYVPVSRSGRIDVVSAGGNEPARAYFDDEQDGLEKQLLVELGEPIFDFIQEDGQVVWEWLNETAPGKFRRISEERAQVFIDEKELTDDVAGRLLSEIAGRWIIDFLVCVAEHKSGSFVKATQKTLAKLRRAALTLNIVDGQKIEIAHNERRIPLPSLLRGGLVLRRASGPVLVMCTAGGRFTLERLSRAAGQLAVALGQRELANGLEVALFRLASSLGDCSLAEEPDNGMIADALGVEPGAIQETLRLSSGDLYLMLHLAIPLAGCKNLPDVLAHLLTTAGNEEIHDEDLRASFEALALACGRSQTQFETEMAHLADLADLKNEFELPIAELNAVIKALGAPYRLVSNEARHRHEWASFLSANLPSTYERLRRRFCKLFDARQSLDGYIDARTRAASVPPDPKWFTTFDEIPDDAMFAAIDRWVESVSPPEEQQVVIDVTLTEAREVNAAKLRDFMERFSPLLTARSSTGRSAQSRWHDPAAARETCKDKSKSNGWLDFRVLTDEAIASWLTLEGLWPNGQAALEDPAAWGLSAEDMASTEKRLQDEHAAQQSRRRQVQFGTGHLPAQAERYADIAAAIAAAVDLVSALKEVSPRETPLKDIDVVKQKAGGRGHSGVSVKPSENAMTDEQKRAVGLMGELWAREWLRRRHKLDTVDENIWVSSYRDSVLNTSGGSDGLGYDFIVETKSRTYYYEVKASTGDPGRFELGPTEIVAAQRCRADREHHYRILYVSNVGDPVGLQFALLTNPFSAKADGKFRLVGKGSVTYEFDRMTV